MGRTIAERKDDSIESRGVKTELNDDVCNRVKGDFDSAFMGV